MIQQETVYITGHQNPDTDSIVSAIAYAYFKNKCGIHAIPCRLGNVNKETDYLLKRFGFEAPMLLKDARITLSDLPIDSPYAITPKTTVRETIHLMEQYERSSLAVLNEDHTIAGYVTKNDLANIGLGDTAAEIELLKHTSVDEIARSIDGTIVFEDDYSHYNGKTSIVALNANKVKKYEVKDRIVIIGNDIEAQQALIEKGAGMLIVVWSDSIDQQVICKAKEYHCPLILSGHGTMNTSRYLFLAPPVHLIMTKDPIGFTSAEFVEDVGNKMLKTRFRSYPVTDAQGKLFGYVSRYHVLHQKNKKLILVDHNEFSQSVRSIEKAQILEVIDHHRINDFSTSQPISFRNEIIGSCATIIAAIFRENQMAIPANLAGLLLGAVISDTLNFQSPTATQKDKDIAGYLAEITQLDLDSFAGDIFRASLPSEKQTMYEMLVQDIKYFDIEGVRTMISQVIVPSVAAVMDREDEIAHTMEQLQSQKELDLFIVCFTSIAENGSVFYMTGEYSQKASEVLEPRIFHRGIFSRKKQIIPMLADVFA